MLPKLKKLKTAPTKNISQPLFEKQFYFSIFYNFLFCTELGFVFHLHGL